jgi:hypothetical protein
MSTSRTTPKPILYLWGAKGGVGTSTVAAVIALHAARQRPVELRATTAERQDELAVLLGVPHTPGATLTLGGHAGDDPLVIIDGGTDPTPPEEASASLLVIRACYLALHRALRNNASRPTGVILVAEPERCLTSRDIVEILGVPVLAIFPVAPAVARMIDAGLLSARPPRFPADAVLAYTGLSGSDGAPS